MQIVESPGYLPINLDATRTPEMSNPSTSLCLAFSSISKHISLEMESTSQIIIKSFVARRDNQVVRFKLEDVSLEIVANGQLLTIAPAPGSMLMLENVRGTIHVVAWRVCRDQHWRVHVVSRLLHVTVKLPMWRRRWLVVATIAERRRDRRWCMHRATMLKRHPMCLQLELMDLGHPAGMVLRCDFSHVLAEYHHRRVIDTDWWPAPSFTRIKSTSLWAVVYLDIRLLTHLGRAIFENQDGCVVVANKELPRDRQAHSRRATLASLRVRVEVDIVFKPLHTQVVEQRVVVLDDDDWRTEGRSASMVREHNDHAWQHRAHCSQQRLVDVAILVGFQLVDTTSDLVKLAVIDLDIDSPLIDILPFD
jgi:hypothetical protein